MDHLIAEKNLGVLNVTCSAADASPAAGPVLRTQGKSTPFSGYELPGRVLATVVGGQVAFEAA